MNLWHGRGGLRVDVRFHLSKWVLMPFRDIIYGRKNSQRCSKRFGQIQKDTGSLISWLPTQIARAEASEGPSFDISHVKFVFHPTKTDIQADENGLSCYLESSKFTPNVAIYERLGFRLVEEMTLHDADDTCSVLYLTICSLIFSCTA